MSFKTRLMGWRSESTGASACQPIRTRHAEHLSWLIELAPGNLRSFGTFASHFTEI